MDKDGVTVGIIVGVTVGIVSARIAQAANVYLQEDHRQAEIAEANLEGFRKGWSEASTSPINIRRRYQEMFGDPEEGGTALQG